MNWINFPGVATAIAAALIASPATAYADCGDPGQEPCTGTVPTVDQVVAILAELTDPNKPADTKTDIVTPGFTPDEAQTLDDHLNQMNAHGGRLPIEFLVTNIQPAPNDLAGATVETMGPGPIYTQTAPKPIRARRSARALVHHPRQRNSLDDRVAPKFEPPLRPRRAVNLAELVDLGLLTRQPYREPGQRTRDQYVLTDAGTDFMPVVWAMFEWGQRHLPGRNRLRLTHVGCGANATVEVRCTEGHRVPPDELGVELIRRNRTGNG